MYFLEELSSFLKSVILKDIPLLIIVKKTVRCSSLTMDL